MANHSEIIKKTISQKEISNRERLLALFKKTPIPDIEILDNLVLYCRRQSLSKLLFMNEIYKKIITVHGIIIEFGVRWGQNLAIFESLRGIYEPYNHNRKIVGFDTFAGFPEFDEKDGAASVLEKGNFSVSENYEDYLEDVLSCHEQESPISHIQKFQIYKGDASTEIRNFLEKNPQTIIAFAFFDFDLYKPTVECLKAIKRHLTKGSVLGFDELNVENYPGETIALQEVFGLDQVRIQRNNYGSVQSYIVIE